MPEFLVDADVREKRPVGIADRIVLRTHHRVVMSEAGYRKTGIICREHRGLLQSYTN